MHLVVKALEALVLFVGGGLLIVAVAEIWRLSDKARPGRPLRTLVLAITLMSCAAATLPRLDPALQAFADFNYTRFYPAICLIITGAAATTLIGLKHDRVFGVRLTIFAAYLFLVVQVLAAASNDEGRAFESRLIGIVLFPGLVTLVAGSGLTRREMVALAARVARLVMWLSYLLLAINPTAAELGDRRLAIGSLTERVGGVTPHPELLALTMLVLILAAPVVRYRFWKLDLVAALAMLVLAESRTSFIALALMWGAMWFLCRGSAFGRLAIAVPALAAATIFASKHGLLNSLVSASESPDAGLASGAATLNSRTDIWSLVWQNTPGHFLGWGPAAFDDHAATPFAPTFFLNAHDQFLEGLAEAGWIGFIAMVLVALNLFVLIGSRRGGAVVVGGSVITLVTMLTEVPFTIHLYGASYVIVTAFLVLAVTIGAARGAEPVEPSEPDPDEQRLADRGGARDLVPVGAVPAERDRGALAAGGV